jgi:hypothetical protein
MFGSWIIIRESHHDLISLLKHDLFGKPVPTFPDHALVAPPFTLNTGKGRKDCPTMANVAAKGGEIEVKVQM